MHIYILYLKLIEYLLCLIYILPCFLQQQERWMCPNHVENFIDSNLVSSTSLTERLKLWNKYGGSKSGSNSGSAGNFNPDTIKLEFFRKVRKGKLYERGVKRARTVRQDHRIKVPQYVKVTNNLI